MKVPKSRFMRFTQFRAFCAFRTDLGKLWLVGAHQTHKQTANIAKKKNSQSPTQLTDDVHLLELGLGLGLGLDLFLSFLGSCLLAGLVLFLMLVFGTCLFAGHHLLYTTPLSPYFYPTSSQFVIFP